MLNYGYAILESIVRMGVTAAGLDPHLGYFHTQWREGRQGLVLDLMEPIRPVVDRAILRFVHGHSFSGGDVTLRDDGVCWLNPQLARNIVSLVMQSAMAPPLKVVDFKRSLQFASARRP
jgi:CRISPR-associated protein Cas1